MTLALFINVLIIIIIVSFAKHSTSSNAVSLRSRSIEIASFGRSHTSSYSSSIATVALTCIVSEIKLDIFHKRKRLRIRLRCFFFTAEPDSCSHRWCK